MPAMTGTPSPDLRHHHRNQPAARMAEPPLHRAPPHPQAQWPASQPDVSVAAASGHWVADPSLMPHPQSAPPSPAPATSPSRPRVHAFVPPAAPGTLAPEHMLDSLPAIPSALYSWPEDPATVKPASETPRPARAPRRDPSPSRLAYRLHRLWLTPFIRRGITVGLPVFLLALTVGLWLGDDARRAQVVDYIAEKRSAFENRPEFQVTSLAVNAESLEVAQAITQRLGLAFPVSSFRLDLEEMRRAIEALDAVETAALRIRSGGVLEVMVLEREPVMVWRHHGGLELVDVEGRRIARLAAREARADLPLIAGDGAPAAIAEAQQLLAAASPLRERLRGLVRVSERRWDVVLDRDQRIMLPAEGAVAALERVLALDAAQDLLARDISVVDLRDATRPTIRLSQPAMAELHRIRSQASGVQNR